MKNGKKLQLLFALVTNFLNFLGFSVIIPIIPFLIEKYVPDQNTIAWNVGLILSVYALCQFIAAPALGSLSDRYGRKPILLISLLGSVIGYLLLGFAGTLWILFLGRIIDGLTGGNISTVYAYVADITDPKDRGKYFGMLGAAGGFGFMIGPAVGGFTAHISLNTPLFLAAAVTFVNLVFGFFVLKESLAEEHKINTITFDHLNPFGQLKNILSIKALKSLFIVTFTFFLALNASFTIYAVFLKDIFNWNPSQIGILLFFVGVMDIVSQGILVQALLKKFHELNITTVGLILVMIGFAVGSITSITPSLILMGIAIVTINIGDGLFEPTMSGLIANSVDHKTQGRVQGANQGIQSIARVVGPLLGAFLYQYWKGLPFASESFLVAIALIITFVSFNSIKAHLRTQAA